VSHYLCRLLDPEGHERGVVPIIGSSIGEAKLTARAVYRAYGVQGSYELWSDTTRLIAHAEREVLAAPEPPAKPKPKPVPINRRARPKSPGPEKAS
jgi:hypothetical protein